jgi:very-short-patch-repair endonuclease
MEPSDLISIRDSLKSIAEEMKEDRNDFYSKLLNICEEIDIYFDERDDYEWPMSIDKLCSNFDLNDSTVRTHMRRYLTEKVDWYKDHLNMKYIERSGAIKIFNHSRSEKANRFLKKYGSVLPAKEQHIYINTIKYAIDRFENIKIEYRVNTTVNNYRIDLYLRNTKLAIECDEHDHYIQEDSEDLRRREEAIKSELGCRFLRFNPHEPDFNLGEVINVVFHHIFNKLIDGKDPIIYYQEKRKRSIRTRFKLSKEQLAKYD